MRAAAAKAKKTRAPAEGLKVPRPEGLALSALNMAPYNPRVMPAAMLRALKASLVKHGLVLNLVVQRESDAHGRMVLVGGHQRVRAMRELCKEKGWAEPRDVSAVVLDLDDRTAKQLNVSLNRIEGEFDPFKLGVVLAEVYPLMTPDDVLALGYDSENIDVLIQETLAPEDRAAMLERQAGDVGDLGGFAASVTLSVEFETTTARDEAKELVRALARGRAMKAGDLVLSLARSAHAAKGAA